MAKIEYENALVGVDALIFTLKNRALQIYLHKREKEPFVNRFELPGGLLQSGETAEQTLQRKLKELMANNSTTLSHTLFFQQFFTFTEPQRDPRERTISIGFIALLNETKITDENNWHDVALLGQLAFDHKLIIARAVEYLKNNVDTIIIKQFMPEEFPLNKLQEAYEIIEQQKYDNRNFRKKMLASGLIVQTRKLETNVSHRPALLFKFKK